MHTSIQNLSDRCNRLARWSGPLAVASLALVVAAEVAGPGMGSPVGVVAAVLGLLAATTLLMGMVGLHVRSVAVVEGRADRPFLLLLAGGALAAGGMWDLVFTVPVLTANAPELLQQQHPSVLAGYLISYGLLGLGALLWTLTLRRHGAISRADGRWLLAGSVVCFTPLPTRFFLLAVAISVVAARASRSPAGNDVAVAA
ncbi:hypothetical protein [Egicoccus sp. AB-alg2]|uniref:hypothetical protein n=1 Tax=Egicoccus sp. AB-alg2 TaxID=3242693 RepID=UPI00359CF4E2